MGTPMRPTSDPTKVPIGPSIVPTEAPADAPVIAEVTSLDRCTPLSLLSLTCMYGNSLRLSHGPFGRYERRSIVFPYQHATFWSLVKETAPVQIREISAWKIVPSGLPSGETEYRHAGKGPGPGSFIQWVRLNDAAGGLARSLGHLAGHARELEPKALEGHPK